MRSRSHCSSYGARKCMQNGDGKMDQVMIIVSFISHNLLSQLLSEFVSISYELL